MTLLQVAAVFSFLSLGAGCVSPDFRIAGEVKCLSLEGDGLCPKLSHLEAGVAIAPGKDWEGRLSYDFAQSRKVSWYDSHDTDHLDLPPERSWLADYGLVKHIDSRWSVGVEDASGTTLIPDASHLAYSGNLQDIGWKQTATRLGFVNEDIFEADILVGLGEGERLSSDDGDLFLGARARWYLAKAVGFQLGYSEDKNALNKDALWWSAEKSELRRGFHARRFAASLLLNGKLPFARGLEASIGWQSNRLSGHDPQTYTPAPLQLAFDPTESLTQSLGGTGDTLRQSIYYSASYRILSEYIIAFHGSQFQSRFGEASLNSCESLDDLGACVGTTDKNRSFRLQETTFGIGKIDNDGWSALLESHEERYDRLYQNFHFRNGRHPRQKNMRLIQARIAWNW